VLDLLAERRLPQQGFLRQEDVPLQEFLANPSARSTRRASARASRLAPREL
jgi:hypothetical protein